MDKQSKLNIVNLLLKCIKQDSPDANLSIHDFNVKTEEGKVKFKLDVEGCMDTDNIEEVLKLFL